MRVTLKKGVPNTERLIVIEDEGGVSIETVDGWTLLTISDEGELILYGAISKELGFKLDKDGVLIPKIMSR